MSTETDREYQEYLDYQEYLKYTAAQQQQAPRQAAPEEAAVDPEPGVMGKIGRGIAAAGDVGLSLVSGAVAQPVAGIAGLGTLLGGGSADDAADVVNATQSGLTWDPKTEGGQQAMRKVGGFIEPIVQKLDDTYYAAGVHNPVAAAALKTVVEGGMSVAGLKGLNLPARAAATRAAARNVATATDQVMKDAKRLGIVFDNDLIQTSVIDAAKKMGAGAGSPNPAIMELRTAVIKAKKASQKGVDDAYNAARATEGSIGTESVVSVAQQTRQQLLDRGFVLDDMPTIRKTLDQMEEIGTKSPLNGSSRAVTREFADINGAPYKVEAANPWASLNDLDALRQRLNRVKRDTPDGAAAATLRENIDAMIDGAFDRAAIAGDPTAIEAWKNARQLARSHAQKFNADRTIGRLVKEAATPEQFGRWILGASAMNAGKQAGQTVLRLRRILAKDPTKIDAIRKSVITETLAPLFEIQPNFEKAARNIKLLTDRNKSLLKSLNMNEKDLDTLRRAAHAAESAYDFPEFFTKTLFLSFVVRHVFGSGLAIKAARVRLANAALQFATGAGKRSERQLVRQFFDTEHQKPLILPDSEAGKVVALNAFAVDQAQRGREETEE